MLGMIDWRPAQELSASVIQTKAGALGRLEEAPDTPITFSPGTCSVDTVDIVEIVDSVDIVDTVDTVDDIYS